MAWSKPRKPVCLVLLLLTNQLAGFPAPIPFRFAYFCHAFPVNKYPRNSPARTEKFGVLDNKSLIRRFVVQYRGEFLLVVCILTRPKGSTKYGTTRKNTQRYYTTKRLIRCIYYKNLMSQRKHKKKLKTVVSTNHLFHHSQ